VLTFGTVGAIALAVIGLNVAMGWAGLLSFGQPVFMAIGGYTSAILATRYSVNPWLALLCGIALSAVVAAVVGFPVLKLESHYFAVATFAMSLIVLSVINGAQGFTGGAIGIIGIPPLTIGSISFADHVPYYILVWVASPRSLRGRGFPGATVPQEVRPMNDELVVSGISKQFSGVKAVSDVSFTVKPGEVHGLVGPNGAGKSTALGILSGFIPPDAGSITYRDRELVGAVPDNPVRAGIARTFQEPSPVAGLTVLENVLTGLHIQGRAGTLRAGSLAAAPQGGAAPEEGGARPAGLGRPRRPSECGRRRSFVR
jgi:ABC-type multidrug transport system fused ATPase/permease subunit